MTATAPAVYTFDNDAEMLGGLAEMFDPFTQHRLTDAGVKAGAHCLEIGAGVGSVAGWMAEQVGEAGRVVATDLDPHLVPSHPSLQVLTHNVVKDRMPDGQWDVVHARAVLQHLPQRREVLAKLAASLKPGGAVVIEEMEGAWGSSVLATPDPRAHEIFHRYHTALQTILRANGNEPAWCRQVYSEMCQLGLTVDMQAWQRDWPGGTGACLLAHTVSVQQRTKLIEIGGMSAEDLDLMATLTRDPRFVLRGVLLLSVTGRRLTDS
ncbi:MAG: class I SAM-dependent methyltransferase [Mycobacterium sp.]|nr:class I SAM-dependent methyltransferase [Mycobacterium sp.]